SDKTGILDLARALVEQGARLLSTGGTFKQLESAGIPVSTVESYTGSPEVMDGRVKTLHPKVHGGILAREGTDEADLQRISAEFIDMVVVNLYAFEKVAAREDAAVADLIENIDIGGPTMIRAAAKNHEDVVVLVKPECYDAVLEEMNETDGEVSASTRHWLANEAFAQTARYDAAISTWFSESYEAFPEHRVLAFEKQLDLSYGENPHQRAALYSQVGLDSNVLTGMSKHHGKALSFNNVLDLDACRKLLADLEGPACV
ncbi:MAG: bifunctional phosphoribosylaminoimidazolecarboxamide formyltransferase/IMP cyclohydrolase, partial [Solirubrobacterales bacterium]|nr:bifunctional phosphoribosylaminoimidazolecarboxamide formyltransferase/IMP cyclohydrolase [Solirubrobacterales bacterium]